MVRSSSWRRCGAGLHSEAQTFTSGVLCAQTHRRLPEMASCEGMTMPHTRPPPPSYQPSRAEFRFCQSTVAPHSVCLCAAGRREHMPSFWVGSGVTLALLDAWVCSHMCGPALSQQLLQVRQPEPPLSGNQASRHLRETCIHCR